MLESLRQPVHAGMQVAIEQARLAPSHGDVPVGAVVLDPDGAVIAAGRNTRERDGDPTAHAELTALRAAAAHRRTSRLDDCVLISTLELCTMCAGAAVLARVSTVVFGAVEPKTGAVVSLWDVVRDPRLNHRPQVIGPWDLPESLTVPCSALLSEFFIELRE